MWEQSQVAAGTTYGRRAKYGGTPRFTRWGWLSLDGVAATGDLAALRGCSLIKKWQRWPMLSLRRGSGGRQLGEYRVVMALLASEITHCPSDLRYFPRGGHFVYCTRGCHRTMVEYEIRK
jgi:hypothetical protein